MGDLSSIEWTDATWNPVTGCTKVSPGCAHCYAERMAERFRGSPAFPVGFDLMLRPDRLDLPLRWKKPRRIFVNSMSDLFHEQVPLEFIRTVFHTMRWAHWHQFQVLTKRSDRLRELAPALDWAPNIWMGVSVESQRWVSRIADLRTVPAAIRFLSLEPLLGPLSLDLRGIDWVIAGGESGPRARRMRSEWAESIRDQCRAACVPFFFKQWGTHDASGMRRSKRSSGRTLAGVTWDQMPSQELAAGAAR
jgi:protein gp37